MVLKIVLSLLVFVAGNGLALTDDWSSCISASHCHLILGDVLRKAGLTDTETKTEYLIAEKLAGLHSSVATNSSESAEKECRAAELSCFDIVKNTAILKLNLSVELSSCDVNTWSYMLFLCKNMIYWPSSVKTVFGQHYSTCDASTCLMNEFQNYHVNHDVKESEFPSSWAKKKKEVNEMISYLLDSDNLENLEGLIINEAARSVNRTFTEMIRATTRETGSWLPIQICPPGTYIQNIDTGYDTTANSQSYILRLRLVCGDREEHKQSSRRIGKRGKIIWTNTTENYVVRWVIGHKSGNLIGSHSACYPDTPRMKVPVYLIGMHVNMQRTNAPAGRGVPLNMVFRCGILNNWLEDFTYTKNEYFRDMFCPGTSAMCSIKTAWRDFGEINILKYTFTYLGNQDILPQPQNKIYRIMLTSNINKLQAGEMQ